jgi:transglutaminase-like putative cysteine protease
MSRAISITRAAAGPLRADATHAWVEAYLPSLGWVGFDPTNNILAGERHIRAAVGRDYADVPPTRGTYKGGADSASCPSRCRWSRPRRRCATRIS